MSVRGLSASRTTLCTAETVSHPHLQESHGVSHMDDPCFCSSSDSQYYKGGVLKVNCNITVFKGKWRLVLPFKGAGSFHIHRKTMKDLWALAVLGIRERPNLAQNLVTHRH